MLDLKAVQPEAAIRPQRRIVWGATWSPTKALLLWLPASLVLVGVLLPPAYLVLRGVGAGTAALELLFRSSTFATLLRTGWLTLTVTLAATVLGVSLAWLTSRTDLPFRRTWSILTTLPLVVPSYVGAYLTVAALGPKGLLQQFLEGLFGLERLPEIYGFPGAFLVLTLLSYPYVLLPVRAAIVRLDRSYEESARSLGQSAWETFWRVTLPQLRPAVVAGGLLVALYCLRDFGAVSILRYDTFTRVIYLLYRSTFDRGAAAAMAMLLVALAFVLLALELRARGSGRLHANGGSGRKPPALIQLGRWRWPATLLTGGVVSLALFLPAGVLLLWLFRGVQAGEALSPLLHATGNSLLASFLAAGITVLAALPVAALSVREPGRLSWIVERLAYSAFSLPGIVIALSLVFFGARYAPMLYQTLPALLFAYAILFLPQAHGALRTALLQIDPVLEEAARSLGRNPLGVFRAVFLPLLRPGLAASASLVFLTTMKELPATLILAPFGFKTLATEVWSSVSEAFFARAAAPALVIILASSIPMAYLVLRENQEAL